MSIFRYNHLATTSGHRIRKERQDPVHEILAHAGIVIDGPMPWDMRINDDRFYERIMIEGSLGLGESYVDGWWDCDRLDEFFSRIMPLDPQKRFRNDWQLLPRSLYVSLVNPGRKSRAFVIGEKHYDIGNDLFKKMLDKRMIYSCGYWKDALDLDEAQEKKLDLTCRKLGLKTGDRVLDIGCGWGGFARYAAERYGVTVVGITVSRQQLELAVQLCEGLPIELRLQDYRDLDETFDHIVSIGMFEHVGALNHRAYMEVVHRCLKDNGLFLFHTIGDRRSAMTNEPWINKYIFPNYLIPSMGQISVAADDLFIMEDVHNFGFYYDRTLMSWFDNFNRHWDILQEAYGERFYRMWKYYLLSCAGSFRSRSLQVWQIVLSKHGVPGGYSTIR
ncbi:MAG: cyclopropane fatty acyl phospholipid synthase [Dissulfurispiraceae bacterium]